MESKIAKKEKGETPSLSQEEVTDLAVMPRNQFMRTYHVSRERYNKFIEEYTTAHLICFLWGLVKRIESRTIIVTPESMREKALSIYKNRIKELNLFEYEKDNFLISSTIGSC